MNFVHIHYPTLGWQCYPVKTSELEEFISIVRIRGYAYCWYVEWN